MATGVDALDAIVLAAGAGKRFGGGKLTSPWGDGVLLDAALATAFASPARTVSVVWGADGRVLEAASRYASRTGQAPRLRMIHAREHEEGMAASMRAGVAGLPRDCAGAFIFLGDMPKVSHDVPARLVLALAAGAWAAAPVHGERRGHPVLFGSKLFAVLKTQTGDRGAGKLLDALGEDLALVPVDDAGVLFDVDVKAG
ncbi:MAG: nucleotidyltransferase family protein [Caulobacter sp.]|nr:nucleotidyltransferase family protein [Caulobacter sp.]